MLIPRNYTKSWLKNIPEIIIELLLPSHTDVEPSAIVWIEDMASSAADGKEEEEADEENVNPLLLSVCDDQVPMKYINVAESTNNNW